MPLLTLSTRALALMTLLAGCGGSDRARIEHKPETLEPPPNVVLLVLDTVRADHLSAYAYARPTTPLIDALARHGTRYTRAMSTAPWTLPSHASMFTGLAPHEHGAHGFIADGPNENDVYALRRDVPVLAEVLSAQGYETAAFCANNVFLTKRWGLDRGFDTYEVRHRHAKAHNRSVLGWLETHARGDAPFFLFVNYIDAHRPYNIEPRAGFLGAPLDRNPRLIDRLRRDVMGTNAPIDEALRGRVIDQYDNAIAHMDDAVGEVVMALDRLGVRERTIVVITSDHGEYFGEHRLVEHNMDVYQPGVHVPLVVYAPGEPPGVDETVVTSEDVGSLIADRIRLKRVRDAIRALSPGPRTHPALSENYYSRPWDVWSPIWGDRFHRVRRAVYEWPYVLIHSSDGAHELYDLASDPAQEHDLAQARPAVVRHLVDVVERDVRDEHEAEGSHALDPQEVAQMRALGYVE